MFAMRTFKHPETIKGVVQVPMDVIQNQEGLAYYDSGSGPALLFLHSFGHSRQMWFPQLHFFRDRGFRVIAPDIPGHGTSPFLKKGHTIENIARSYVELLSNLKIDTASLIGISFGGYVALEMYKQSPNTVGKMVLSNTKAEADTDEIKERRRNQIQTIKNESLEVFVERGAEKRLSPQTCRYRPWVVDLVKILNLSLSAEANTETLEAMIRKPDHRDILEAIKVPALVIKGGEDKFIPPNSAEILNELIPNSRLETLQDVGHVSNLEAPDRYNQLVMDFLAQAA